MQWKYFGNLIEACYNNFTINPDFNAWAEAFAQFLVISEENRHAAPELYLLDDLTDYEYSIYDWVDDYLDFLADVREYETILQVCEKLLNIFDWKEDNPSELYFHTAAALGNLGRTEEALAYCEDWLKKEPDNVLAAAASIYAKISARDFSSAEEIVKRYISEDTPCTDDNDVLFTAAQALYQATGNKKEGKRIKKALKEYDNELGDFLMDMLQNSEDFDFSNIGDEDNMPFE